MADAILADVESSGIYQIRNLVNGKLYIGSAKCFRVRWNSHKAKLRKGRHHSPHLQSSWLIHGEESFAFEVVDLCGIEDLIVREQVWLDALTPEFNICRVAGSTLGRKFSDSSKAKIAAKAIGRKCPPRSAEHRANLSAAQKGRVISPEHMAALQAGRATQTFSHERRLAVSAGLRRCYENGTRSRERSPEYREKIARGLRGKTIPDDVRKKIGDAQRGIKKGPRKEMSPEALLRVTEANRNASQKRIGIKRSAQAVANTAAALRGRKLSDEHKQKLILINLARWSDPLFRAKMSAIHKARWHKKRANNDRKDVSGL